MTTQISVTREEFDAYRRVQKIGRFNMLDPRARKLTGLSREVYYACIDSHDELLGKWGKP